VKVIRIVLGALREARRPLNIRDTNEVLTLERGLQRDPLKMRRSIPRRVGACLNHWKRVKKMLRSSSMPGQMFNWEIATSPGPGAYGPQHVACSASGF
jgi:hypothetical protein